MANLHSSEFQRAFVALSYMTGRREAELLGPLSKPHDETRAFARQLAHSRRERRAEALARELSRLVSALEARVIT